MWPGFMANSVLCNDGIFLNVDTATKFINKKSLLDLINKDLAKKTKA